MPLCAVAGGWWLVAVLLLQKKKNFLVSKNFPLQGIEPMSHLGEFLHWGPLFCNVTL